MIQRLVERAEQEAGAAGVRALELLGKHVGMFKERVGSSHDVRITKVEHVIVRASDTDSRGIPAPITVPQAAGHA